MKCVPWILVVGLFACNGDKSGTVDATGDTGDTDLPADTDVPATLAIAGTYTDEFGTQHLINESTWSQTSNYGTSTWAIVTFDNAGMFVVAQNSATNPYSPSLWSRFDWVGDLHYCQTAYDAANEADAAATPRPDDADLVTGCSGFPWTDLTP